MAVVAGVVQEAWDFTEAVGPGVKVISNTSKVLTCKVSVTFPSGTYASADDANFAAATAIQNERKNGKTVTVLTAACIQPGDENGSPIFAGNAAVTAGTALFPLLQADLSTERANGAMSATWNRPLIFQVSFSELLG